MSSKRKRDVDESMSTPNAKQMKLEEVTRSGRVRKKPAKFTSDGSTPTEAELDKSPPPEVVMSPPSPAPAVTMVMPVATPAPLPPVKYEAEPDWKDDSMEEDCGKGGSRSSRARKKSAKVLEMEEFEEAEKKQTVKKGDLGKRMKSSVQNVPILQPGPSSGSITPTSPIPILKIKDIPTMPKVETMVQVIVSPHESPVAGSKSPVSVKKSPDSKGSVIKLLLNSPAQSAGPSVSTTSMSQPSPVPDTKPQTTGKKLKGKKSAMISPEPKSTPKAKQSLHSPPAGSIQIQPGIVAAKHKSVKSEPQETLSEIPDNMLEIETVSETSVQTSVKEIKSNRKGSKKKTIVKDESPFLPPPVPSPNVIHVGPVHVGLEVKQELGDAPTPSSSKKGKKASKMKQVEPAKLDMSEDMIHEDFGLDMPEIELGDTGDESFMEMDDEHGLMMHEEEVEMGRPKKSGKKKAGKAGKAKIQLGDIPSSDGELVMDFARMKPEEKKLSKKRLKMSLKLAREYPGLGADLASKKKRAPTAYMLWCSLHRPKLVYENPDFSSISKRLGEMWSNLSEKEKMMWKRKAKKAAGKGSTLITTGKAAAAGRVVPQITTARQAAALSQKTNPALAQALLATKQIKPTTIEDPSTPIKGFGMDPIDVAAHLKIVGESLSIIGMKLQEHRGLIAVQGSLSVLLDSMLCAVAPLMCLTSVLPETNGLPAETHMKTLDNIAYIMPGL